jgi:broad specificity phosphatase PhoE
VKWLNTEVCKTSIQRFESARRLHFLAMTDLPGRVRALDRAGPDPAAVPAGTAGFDVWLVRHGETEWSRLGRHTGRTDVPLTDLGREQAYPVAAMLAGHRFALVLSSPRSRAMETSLIAGFGDRVMVEDDLVEWDYGVCEGWTTLEIEAERPGWTIWTGHPPGGETSDEVGRRADRVISRARAASGDVLLFGHGHQLRILAARWLGLAALDGRLFALATATVSVLGWEHGEPVIERWNMSCGP